MSKAAITLKDEVRSDLAQLNYIIANKNLPIETLKKYVSEEKFKSRLERLLTKYIEMANE